MFSSLSQIENYLKQFIPKTSQMMFIGNRGIVRTKEFLKLLGSPQNKLKVIHVAGTSGKGSTSFMISKLLEAHSFKVGLHLSPHLIDIRERVEINNSLLSKTQFCSYFNTIIPAIEKMKSSPLGAATYFEILVGFAYFVFVQEKVEYAVIETGLGGEFDGTNVGERKDKLAVITKIGFDHTKVLGNTFTKIAHQKAMICVEGGELITIYQYPSAEKEIRKVVREKKGTIYLVPKFPSSILSNKPGSQFSFVWNLHELRNITLGLIGEHQVQNASLAIATFCHLSARDTFKLDENIIKQTLAHLRFKGRFDVISQKNNHIILDGAHNVQKMKALLHTLKEVFPHKKFTFVLAFKQGKEYKKMLKRILPFAEKIIITQIFSDAQDLLHFSVKTEKIAEEIYQLGFENVMVIKNIKDIIKIMEKGNSSYVVSGSLYLLGDIYKALE